MHPSSGNTKITLLKIDSITDSIGVKRVMIVSSHEVIGFTRSLTTSEYTNQTSVSKIFDFKVLIQSFLYKAEKYALINDEIYKIERTYLNGQYQELYFTSSNYKIEDLVNDSENW